MTYFPCHNALLGICRVILNNIVGEHLWLNLHVSQTPLTLSILVTFCILPIAFWKGELGIECVSLTAAPMLSAQSVATALPNL